MTQPWSNQAVSLIVIQGGGTGTGFFLYNGTPGPGNPPVLWAVAPGVTADPFGTPVAAVLGAGNPGGANTQIDALGDISLTGVGGSVMSLMPAGNVPFGLTSAITGVLETLINLGSGDGSQTQAGIVSGITLGTGTAAKEGTLIMSPYAATGTGILLQAVNDGGTDVASMLVGTVTTQGGTITFTPTFGVLPGAVLGYSGAGTVTVVTRTSGSGTIPIPVGVTVGKGEAWGPSGNRGKGNTGGGGGGGGGGEYAQEPSLALTSGGTAAYSVGAHLAATTLTGSAVTVTANFGADGNDATTSNPGAGGNHGTGSGNTIHNNGGFGGTGGAAGGGGGGASGGPGGVGGDGNHGAPGGSGQHGMALAGGANGGDGGTAGNPGAVGHAPGGAPGGNGEANTVAGTAVGGQVRLTYTTGSPSIYLAIATAAGTDQFGTAYKAGAHFTGPDGNLYAMGSFRAWLTSGQLVNSLTAAALTFQQPASATSFPVVAGTYLVRGQVIVLQGAAGAGNQAIQITGPATSLVDVAWHCIEAATIFSSGVATALASNLTTGAVPISTTGTLQFQGMITFTAAGNIGINVLCVTAAADTWTAGTGTFLELNPI